MVLVSILFLFFKLSENNCCQLRFVFSISIDSTFNDFVPYVYSQTNKKLCCTKLQKCHKNLVEFRCSYSADLNYPDETNKTWIFKRVFLKLGWD